MTQWFARLLLLAVVLATCPHLTAQEKNTSADASLQVLYDFNETSGKVVHDRAGLEPAIDLTIADESRVQWNNGMLSVHGTTQIASATSPRRLMEAIQESGEMTVEVWFRPERLDQKGPARIVSLSADTSQRNFTLGQDGADIEFRLRTTKTSDNGLPAMATKDKQLATTLTHVVVSRDKQGAETCYLNGKAVAALQTTGDFANWNGNYRLALANELTGDRPWLGELHQVAIYNRTKSAAEVAASFSAGIKPAIDFEALLPPVAEKKVDFVRDIQPLFRARCFECHAQGNEEGGLNLGIRDRVLQGGEHGPVILAGKSAASSLIHMVAAIDADKAMPPEGKRLSAEEVGLLRAWIDQGANWPAGADVLDPRTEKAKSHWAFQPLHDIALPEVRDKQWPRSPVDHFILAKLEDKNWQPTAPLDRRRLIRRLYFDLIGLPPTPQQMQAALDDWQVHADDAVPYAPLVDRLIASEHFGERWGRHWLDIARYADSNGQEADQDRPGAFYYRDFVIHAFNDDLPFDQFVQWQVAGDELQPDNPQAVAATGFLVAGTHTVLEDSFLEEERLRNRYNELDDMVSTLGTGLLGLTLGCARCHDHKYDAISAREYYQLLAAFHGGNRREVKLKNDPPSLVFRDFGSEPAKTWLFHRGDFYDRQQEVQLGFPLVLLKDRSSADFWSAAKEAQPLPGSSYQRKALALWLTDVKHGAGALVARVMVNRMWQHHFGEGLSKTTNDFGVRGEVPSHPELLEWLAQDLVTHGWQLKRLHRLMVTSATYAQGIAIDEAKLAEDPTNRLLWRRVPQRIEAEIVRDSILAVSGRLNLQAYGPAFVPPIAAEANFARNLKSPYPKDVAEGPAVFRRTVYMFHKRVIPYPLLQAFDRPDALQSCSRRDQTTVAPQALALLNDAFVRNRAVDFADDLLQQGINGDENLVTAAFQRTFARNPSSAERLAAEEFLTQQIERRKTENAQAEEKELLRQSLADFCQTLFSTNEFVYVD